MYYIWLIGAFIFFLITVRYKDNIIDMYISRDELSRLNYEKYGDGLIFTGLLIASLLWPLILVLVIINLFNANS